MTATPKKKKSKVGKDKSVQAIFQIDLISDEQVREASLVMAGISIELNDPVGLGIVLTALGLKEEHEISPEKV
jgi:hypothetical protein